MTGWGVDGNVGWPGWHPRGVTSKIFLKQRWPTLWFDLRVQEKETAHWHEPTMLCLSQAASWLGWVSKIKHCLMFLMPIAMPNIQRRAAQALSNTTTASNFLGTEYSNQNRSCLVFLAMGRHCRDPTMPSSEVWYSFYHVKHRTATNVGIPEKDRSWWALFLPLLKLQLKPNLNDALGQRMQVLATNSLFSSLLVPIVLYWEMKYA